jgi:hypothetical protein
VHADPDVCYNVQQNTVIVKVDAQGALEYKYNMLLSGGPSDSAHLKVYVQGFIVEDTPKSEPRP